MNDAWNWDADYKRAWHETADPRILAVIERDESPSSPYGDALAPAFYVEYNGDAYVAERAGDVYHDDESDELAARYLNARGRFRYAAGYRYNGLSIGMIMKSEDMLKRWLRIFHDTEATVTADRDYTILLLNTPAFREHCGMDAPDWSAADSLDGERSEWSAYLSGDVYGIGYAVDVERTESGTPVDLDAFDVDIEVWGYYGDERAKQGALYFEGGKPVITPATATDPTDNWSI